MNDRALSLGCLVVLALGCACDSSRGSADEPAEVPEPAGQQTPASYFYFSSDDDAVDVLSEPGAIAVLGDATVIAGIDPGGDLESSEFQERIDALRAQGRRLHVYLEGPGGPTGDAWTADECERITAAATSVGLSVPEGDDCGDDDAPWLSAWNESGFLLHVEHQLALLSDYDVYSVEVDNLARAGFGEDQAPLSEFLALFADARARAGSAARLLLKNIESGAELEDVVQGGERELVADYMILEEYLAEDWCELATTAKEHAVTAAFSWDTYHFHAEVDDRGRDLLLAGPMQAERRRFDCASDR